MRYRNQNSIFACTAKEETSLQKHLLKKSEIFIPFIVLLFLVTAFSWGRYLDKEVDYYTEKMEEINVSIEELSDMQQPEIRNYRLSEELRKSD